MNKQSKDGIEWTQYTWNVVGGCQHDCRWEMPDGNVAQCYAKSIVEKMATWNSSAYVHGFEHHYWNPSRLVEPAMVKQPARIFLDSMSDLMGAWVPDEQIQSVLDACKEAYWHTFQLLTKNAPRLLKFKFPPNVWVGASVPPSWYRGQRLTADQQLRMLARTLEVLGQVDVPVRWMSIEPLSFDIAPYMERHALQWVVIGAASRGTRIYQPEPQWVINLLYLMMQTGTPVFFKGNLRGNAAARVWREEFPGVAQSELKAQPPQETLQDVPLF